MRNQLAISVVTLGVLATATVTLVAYFGEYAWPAELLTHFRLHYVAASLMLVMAALILRLRWQAVAGALLCGVNFWFIAEFVTPDFTSGSAGPVAIRALAANVNMHNDSYALLHSLIAEQNADVIGLVEVNQAWVNSLQVVADYPYQILRPEEGAYGLALFSRFPMVELPESPFREGGSQTAILAELDAGGRKVKLVLAHLIAPTSPDRASLRNLQLDNLSAVFRTHSRKRQILFGDLNVTPFSPSYTTLVTGTGLVNAMSGKAYLGTWPAFAGFMGIPIDHFLLSESMRVVSIRTGPAIGSDHRPVIIDIAL